MRTLRLPLVPLMRSFLVYLALVGAPLLGLLGILRAGERVVPPHHAGGKWALGGGVAALLGAACPGLVFPESGAVLDVSQSGTRARLTLNDGGGTVLDATLRGRVLAAPAEGRTPAACGGRGLRLRATLDSLPGGGELRGSLSVPGCAGCAAVPFRGVRVADTSSH